MVKLGALVKNTNDNDLGMIVKITEYNLNKDVNWKQTHDKYPEDYHAVVRPGHVVSVRWQNKEKNNLTTHVFYAMIKESVIDMGDTGTVELVL